MDCNWESSSLDKKPKPVPNFPSSPRRKPAAKTGSRSNTPEPEKPQEKRKYEPRSQIPKRISRFGNTEPTGPGLPKNKINSYVPSRPSRLPVINVERPTSSTKTEHLRNRLSPKPRAMNTVTSSLASKQAGTSSVSSKEHIKPYKNKMGVRNLENMKLKNKSSDLNCKIKTGAGEFNIEITDEMIEDTTSAINELASRIHTVPSSSMDLCREVMYQKEKLISFCMSKIENISQNNFEYIRNELKETLTSCNAEGDQLTAKLDFLKAQQLEVIGSLMADITQLVQEKYTLLESTKKLSITQDKCNEDLQNKIEFLTSENENISKKLTETVDQFEKEKAKMEVEFSDLALKSNNIHKETVEKYNQEVNLKTEEIKLLKEKINNLTEQVKEMKTELSIQAKRRAESNDETASLHTQLTNVHYTLKDLTNENKELEKMMVQKTLELEQRDHVLQAQTRSLAVKNQLIEILKTTEENQKENMDHLGTSIINQEKCLEMVNGINNNGIAFFESDDADSSSELIEASKNYCFNSGRMSEIYTMLEKKDIMIMRVEKQLRELEGIHEKAELQRVRYEARINQLEQALYEKCLENPGLIPLLVR